MAPESYQIITDRLRDVRTRALSTGIMESVMFVACIGLIIIMGSVISESYLYFLPAVKLIIVFLLPAVLGVTLAGFVINRIIRLPDPANAARMVERTFPELNDRLISAVQLGCLDSDTLRGQSSELVEALVTHVAEEISSLDVTRAVSRRWLLYWTRLFGAVAVITVVLALVMPGRLGTALARLADYSGTYRPPFSVSISFTKQPDSIIKGEDFTVSGKIEGENPEDPVIVYRWRNDQKWNVKPFEAVDAEFNVTLEKPRTGFQYYLEKGRYRTDPYEVAVIERPEVEHLTVTLDYPAYTGMNTVERDDNDGNVRAPAGSVITLDITANKPLTSMILNWSDSTSTECTLDGMSGTVSFNLDEDRDYSIGLVDTLGIKNTDPIVYRVTSMTDEPPAVAILSPVTDITLPHSMTFPLVYRAQDDFGVSRAVLVALLPYAQNESRSAMPIEAGKRDVLTEYEWNMANMGLLPDDEVRYFIEVFDNDTINGPKRGVSDTLRVMVPSITDLLSETMEQQEEGIESLRDMTEMTRQHGERLEDVKRKIMSGENLDWAEKNAIEGSKQELEGMRENMRQLSDAIEQSAERLSEEDMAALETLEQMRTVAEMMDRLADGPMKDALKRLTQASGELDPEKLKKALDEYTLDAEKLKEKFDRLIDLMEQVMALQQFETAKNILEKIAADQAEIAGQFAETPADSSLSPRQEATAVDMDNLTKELERLAGELEEQFEMNTSELTERLSQENVAENMHESAEKMSDGDRDGVSQSIQQSQQGLSRLMETMSEMSAMMKSMTTEEMKQRLFTAASQLLAVARSQEETVAATRDTDTEDLARRQLEVIDGLDRARKSLAEVSDLFTQAAPMFDQLMNIADQSSKSALDAFATGSAKGGSTHGNRTLSTINQTVMMLSTMMDNQQGQQGSMPGDLMQQLQQLADGQLSLQGRMNSQMSQDMLAQLAAEQMKLAEQLSEIAQKASQDKRLREMLEKLTQDMDDTANMMSRNEERQLIERRQLDIYRRLLDARRSRREKDEESPERKSFTAKRDISGGAESLADDLGEGNSLINERINQVIKDDFNPEYLKLIRRYFESLLGGTVEANP